MSARLVKEKNLICRKKGKNSNFLGANKELVSLVAAAPVPAKGRPGQIHLNYSQISAKLPE
jgi:hypothetical protein